jgi:hypothetical protein
MPTYGKLIILLHNLLHMKAENRSIPAPPNRFRIDADLAAVNATWPTLPAAIRAGI